MPETYNPDEHESISHVYAPPNKGQALCGWQPPHTDFEQVPLTAVLETERCSRCVEQMDTDVEAYSLMPPEDWNPWEAS